MTNRCPNISSLHLCAERLAKENRDFCGTGGVSAGNQSLGFTPAFCDTETGQIYPSRHKDGSPAPIHLLEGLPEALIISRDTQQNSVVVKPSVIPGFIKEGIFYTREQAAELVNET